MATATNIYSNCVYCGGKKWRGNCTWGHDGSTCKTCGLGCAMESVRQYPGVDRPDPCNHLCAHPPPLINPFVGNVAASA
jgi:hypothetical protein